VTPRLEEELEELVMPRLELEEELLEEEEELLHPKLELEDELLEELVTP